MNRDSRNRKLRRLRSGAQPRVLDLFSGCGGISLGFHSAGFEIASSVELDPLAAASHHLNFHGSAPVAARLAKDITTIDAGELVAEFAPAARVEEAIDVIVGGPPCQAFARVGRAKLREVRDHPRAFKQDPRGNLYLRYLAYVEELQPVAILMENVPDVINYGGHNIAEETCEALASMGYVSRYTLLNTVYYGVPQSRERMFLIAYARELATEVSFPEPTHWFKLPKGYHGSRQVALKHVNGISARGQLSLVDSGSTSYVEPPQPTIGMTPAVTAHEALHDLPEITNHLHHGLPRGARRLNEFVPYRRVRPSPYEKLMRTWRGFESDSGVYDHTIRSLSERDFEIFRRMSPGDQYPEAHKIALAIFAEELASLKRHGPSPSRDSAAYRQLMKLTVPPYDPEKFPNKWRKMAAHEPARTLMAHLGKDTYSHIHYDSRQARTISVREAARLMSFPDGFRFVGTMNPAFRQIGNAVPPLMALALGREVMKTLTGSVCKEESLLSA
ncbi:MAG TPA: DNA cytosine methyltransferase [Thermoanaerobaculia bacterium]|nr:DNA cytosine methyltransferase [Thermoanaerobaculia bacterium]